MNLRAALLPFLIASSSSSSSHDDNQHDASASSLSSSSASSSVSDIQDIRVSMNDDAYGGKKKLNAAQQRNKLHLLHDPSPSSELTNLQDHLINVDGSTRSDASKNQDIGYLDHRRLSEDPPSDEASQRHRELESREAYCEDLCQNSERPEIQDSGTAFNVLIQDFITNGGPGNDAPIGCWNTSTVTDMSGAFYVASDFNEPNINCWDVSSVTNMAYMFNATRTFDQPLDGWNVSNVSDMGHMFQDAAEFNQPINEWNVAKVDDMYQMFWKAYDFDQPLNDWNVSKVTNMWAMFSSAESFNQPLNDWNVAQVNNMSSMFFLTKFNQPVNDWNVGKVTNMRVMFFNAKNFNQPVDDWNVTKVTDMSMMFLGVTNFNQCILSWAEKTSLPLTTSNMLSQTDCPISSKSPNQNVGPWCRDSDCPTSSPTMSLAPTSAPTMSLAPTSSPTTSLAPTSAPTMTPTERPTGVPTTSLAPTSAPTTSLAPTSAPTPEACANSAKFDCDKHSTGFKKRKCSKKIRKKWGVNKKFSDVCPQLCNPYLCTCVDRVEKFSIKGVEGDHTCADLIGKTYCRKFTDTGFGVNKLCPNKCKNTRKCIN